mgnify:CR=1 FL=1
MRSFLSDDVKRSFLSVAQGKQQVEFLQLEIRFMKKIL